MVGGEDAVVQIRTSIEEREEFIGRLRSTMVEGYWFCITHDYGEHLAFSSRMGMDQRGLLEKLTVAKLIGYGCMNELKLQGHGLCKRTYGNTRQRSLWFALFVDGEAPREGPDQQIGKNPAKPMPEFELCVDPAGPPDGLGHSVKRIKDKDTAATTTRRSPEKEPEHSAKTPMVTARDRTSKVTVKKQATVVGKQLFNDVTQKRDELGQQLHHVLENSAKDNAAADLLLDAERARAASLLAAERERHRRERQSDATTAASFLAAEREKHRQGRESDAATAASFLAAEREQLYRHIRELELKVAARTQECNDASEARRSSCFEHRQFFGLVKRDHNSRDPTSQK